MGDGVDVPGDPEEAAVEQFVYPWVGPGCDLDGVFELLRQGSELPGPPDDGVEVEAVPDTLRLCLEAFEDVEAVLCVGCEVHGEDGAADHHEYVVQLGPDVHLQHFHVAVLHGRLGRVPPPPSPRVVDVGVVELLRPGGGEADVGEACAPEAAVPGPGGPPETVDPDTRGGPYALDDGLLDLADGGGPEGVGPLSSGGVDVVGADAVVAEVVPEGVVVPGGACVAACLVGGPEGESDAPAEPASVDGEDPGELQDGDVPRGVVHDAGREGGRIDVAVHQEEPVGVPVTLYLRDEEGQLLPTGLDDGCDPGLDASPFNELPEELSVLVGDVDYGGDGLNEAYVVTGGVARDAEVGPLVDDVGLVAVLLDDYEAFDIHLLEPEEEAVPEAHPVPGGPLLGEDDLILTRYSADVLGGDVDDFSLDAIGAGCANLAVGGAGDLHLQGLEDLQLGSFWIADVPVEAEDLGF